MAAYVRCAGVKSSSWARQGAIESYLRPNSRKVPLRVKVEFLDACDGHELHRYKPRQFDIVVVGVPVPFRDTNPLT